MGHGHLSGYHEGVWQGVRSSVGSPKIRIPGAQVNSPAVGQLLSLKGLTANSIESASDMILDDCNRAPAYHL